MSHWSVSKVAIRNPNADLLKDVVSQIASEMKGQIVSEIRMWGGKTQSDFIIAIKTPSMPDGVGIRVKDGQVELVADFWLIGEHNKKLLENELTKNYTAAAIQRTLTKMGYRVQTQKTPEKVMLVANN